MTTPDKKDAKRRPIKARPQPDADLEAIREDIMMRFSKSLERLAK